ncbi:MAG: response regulator, partial [Bacteroidaceae bacterium]|nr:response regulator [Bacteroidaceae bacterium]
MNRNSQVSDVQIIDFGFYASEGKNTILQQLMPDSQKRVYTEYNQNTIRLTFTVRDFAQAESVEYSYMMKGMDNKWYNIENDHDVIFRGLQPGHYTFILRAKLKNQDWENAKQTQLEIIINPPFWRTWWAYILYTIALIMWIVWLMRSYKRRLTLRNSLELEKRESQQKQELNEERLRFFTNITHELRTPLTLILGPLEDLADDKQLPQTCRRRVSMIQKSADRLRELINEILEFRKAETQNRRLTVAKGDLGKFVREIGLYYNELNRNPKVKFELNIDENLPNIYFDSEIITTVLNNLLSNAIKYTEEGSISTTVSMADDGMVSISVADTGYGISPEALPHVFERYYQANDGHQASGTGIGLALVKSLADLHEAQLSVESTEGRGSCFTLSLSIDNTYPNALHKDDESGVTDSEEDMQDSEQETQSASMPTLLVVEDNADIRQYIADSFCDDFRIIEATNGEEGVQMAQEQIPDIIVSDIMMPKMNGIQLTRMLKGDIRTSHIPIILLTAKDSDEDKEDGYDSGADSYITKPFTAKLLASRIKNLLTAR